MDLRRIHHLLSLPAHGWTRSRYRWAIYAISCLHDTISRTLFVVAGPGTESSTGGFIPYPGYEYFRNDMWYFDLTSNKWVEVSEQL